MSKPLDELFIEWLYSQVADSRMQDSSRTYWKLFKQLYQKDFIWLIPNDDNRAMDGQELRHEFIRDKRLRRRIDQAWMNMPCSFLEMMIGLSRRLAFQVDGEPDRWFWELMRNLTLDQYRDDIWDIPSQDIEEIADTVMWRTYEPSGEGGFFPLDHAREDQRDVEIQYQMGAYILELWA